jgi:hypothetical protein
MVDPQKIQSELLAWVFTMVFVFTFFGRYGREAIEWVLMKAYEFFIIGNPVK